MKLRELWYILFRNVFLFTNGLIVVVVVLLIIFGEVKTGVFLGGFLLLNIGLGVFQEVRAWLTLQKLQLLTAPQYTRLNSAGKEEKILTEAIRLSDRLALKIGDRVPCDGILTAAHSLEINEGLITGESDSVSRLSGERLLAGSVITSGSGILSVEKLFQESRVARMTEGIRTYAVNHSPIQKAVGTAIQYSIYVLLAGIVFVILRGLAVGETPLRMVISIGAITSSFVPQGLVFAVTLFFAYGALHFFRRQVLLQEVNATEKLGRIVNLCMDKTGTLTNPEPEVEAMYMPPGISKDKAENLTAAYLHGSQDSSETVQAMKKFIQRGHNEAIAEVVAFSSWRQYGAVRLAGKDEHGMVFVGLPDKLLPSLASGSDQQWLAKLVAEHAHLGKRLVAVCSSGGSALPKDLAKAKLTLISALVFHNSLRDGIRDTVDFFQNRGVRIRIISGDNPETTRAISSFAGIRNAELVISGKEMHDWSEADYREKVGGYSVFAAIEPEQKEKIITAFKATGFTAMVGDGANDALAVKKADLGIAMFAGASATRQLAAVVLMNNSFSALPGGVQLADMIIRNIEIFSSLFFNQSMLSIGFFIIISALGHAFPLTPLNLTFINYFTVGIPGLLFSYWTLRPVGKVQPAGDKSFFQRVLPFAAWSAVLQAAGVATIFLLSPPALQNAQSNPLVLIAFVAFGFAFFSCAAGVYRENLSKGQRWQLVGTAIVEIGLLALAFRLPLALSFFTIAPLAVSVAILSKVAAVIFVFCILQYLLARRFSAKNI